MTGSTPAAPRTARRVSDLFGLTLREAPAEAEAASHRLLLRAGYVRQLAAGIFSYLPLGWRSARKIERILREEMDRIGGQELAMPVVHPAEPWRASGRWDEVDETMVRFRDRRDREMTLAMTHEEIVAGLAATEVLSYRQLPQLVYQIQTKFRDELRSRGGLIRVREFRMKDSYSLDRDAEGLARQYQAHFRAYLRIGARVGLDLLPVRSDVGMMGGEVAHEFMYVTPIGEDALVLCDTCGYAANREVAGFRREPQEAEQPRPLEPVDTPGARTIAELCELLGIEPARTGKMVFYVATLPEGESAARRGGEAGVAPDGTGHPRGRGGRERLVAAIVRGDMEANPLRVQRLVGALALRPAEAEEIEAAGMSPGFASPVGIDPGAATVVIDDLVAATPNLVLGANEPDRHLLHVCAGRDYEPDLVGPIAAAYEEAPCEECGAPLRTARGVEVGNIFRLGTRYAERLGAFYADEEGAERPIWMGSYGIGIGRLLACVAEEHRDERGLALPVSVAPYGASLVSLARSAETREACERLYRDLATAGVEVLYDDRDEASAGVKLADADLHGLPLRIVVGERSKKAGGAEIKLRREEEAEVVALDRVVEAVRARLTGLRTALQPDTDSPSGG